MTDCIRMAEQGQVNDAQQTLLCLESSRYASVRLSSPTNHTETVAIHAETPVNWFMKWDDTRPEQSEEESRLAAPEEKLVFEGAIA